MFSCCLKYKELELLLAVAPADTSLGHAISGAHCAIRPLILHLLHTLHYDKDDHCVLVQVPQASDQ